MIDTDGERYERTKQLNQSSTMTVIPKNRSICSDGGGYLMMPSDSVIKSLYKALKILECFTAEKPELGITEISESLGLYKSNVHSVLSTFQKVGYIEKNHTTGKYRLGMKVLELSHVINGNNNFRKMLLPCMQTVSNVTNENVYLGMCKDDEVLYLDSCCPPNSALGRSIQGERIPLYCTGIGKAILAFLPQDKVNNILSSKLKRFTENTIADKTILNRELETIRDNGYSIDNMEHEFGIKCVGMPIFDENSNVIAGIGVLGPSLRFNDHNTEFFVKTLRENIMPIQNRLRMN